MLLASGADVNAQNQVSGVILPPMLIPIEDGDTPMHLACYGSAQSLLCFLRHGANPTLKNKVGVASIVVSFFLAIT
jgi:ankyrin repeat protein